MHMFLNKTKIIQASFNSVKSHKHDSLVFNNCMIHYKATPNKFPVSRPPPASISSEHQKFHYFRILPLFPCFLVYSGV